MCHVSDILDISDNISDILNHTEPGIFVALPRSLALGMARLGLRHPEIFRCLGQVVRRSGLWSFADSEAPSLWKGTVFVIAFIKTNIE